VQQAIAGVIYRRTKEFMLDGKKVIELPKRTEEWILLEFMPEERAMYLSIYHIIRTSSKLELRYDFVEKKAQAVFNRFLQAGTVLK
jgi:hypothetical protein